MFSNIWSSLIVYFKMHFIFNYVHFFKSFCGYPHLCVNKDAHKVQKEQLHYLKIKLQTVVRHIFF